MKVELLLKKKELEEPDESLYRIQRALTGYISYLAACDTNPTFTEYGLYEIIIRILMQRNYTVKCEDPCKGMAKKKKGGRGDDCKIDFTASKGSDCFAMEVKWPRTKKGRYGVKSDHDKLLHFWRRNNNARLFLCVFGRYNDIKDTKPRPGNFVERLFTKQTRAIYAFFGRTQFGCRLFELIPSSKEV